MVCKKKIVYRYPKVKAKFLGISSDWLILISILLFLSCHFATNYILTTRSNTAAELNYSQEVVNAVEANPVARWAFNLGMLAPILMTMFMPAVVFGFYLICRKYYTDDIAMMIAGIFFYVSLCNATNDIAYLIAILARGG